MPVQIKPNVAIIAGSMTLWDLCVLLSSTKSGDTYDREARWHMLALPPYYRQLVPGSHCSPMRVMRGRRKVRVLPCPAGTLGRKEMLDSPSIHKYFSVHFHSTWWDIRNYIRWGDGGRGELIRNRSGRHISAWENELPSLYSTAPTAVRDWHIGSIGFP